jgi:hypothetical protein
VAPSSEWKMSLCPNCSAELVYEYCARCGQRRIHPQDLSAQRFVRELVDEIANFHAKFKTMRTLRALLVPGLLTREYLAGRRQSHLSPFKIYLVCAAIFFLLAPVAGFTLASMLDSDPSSVLSGLVSARASEVGLDPSAFNARFDVRVQTVFTIILGVVALVVALALQLLFRREARPYGAHLIFALHYVAVMYLITVAAGGSRRLGLSGEAAALGAYALIVPYLILALRRVYSESTGLVLLKAAALCLLTIVLNGLADYVAIRLTLTLV